jgi:plastocyanin
MAHDFSVTGAAAVLALAACGETAEGNVTFGFDPVGHNGPFGAPYEAAPALARGANVHVSVQRTFSGVGTHRYHCTIHQRMFGEAAQ